MPRDFEKKWSTRGALWVPSVTCCLEDHLMSGETGPDPEHMLGLARAGSAVALGDLLGFLTSKTHSARVKFMRPCCVLQTTGRSQRPVGRNIDAGLYLGPLLGA